MNKVLKTLIFGAVSLSMMNFPAMAASKVSDMQDLDTSHWAYKAIQQCVEKYQIMEGFPDNSFKGGRTVTRYEAAASFYKIMLRAEQLVRQNMISQEDLKLLKDLTEEFKIELAGYKKMYKDQQDKITAMEKKLDEIKKDFGVIRFGGYLSARMDDTFQDTKRPSYGTDFGIDMNVAVSDKVSVSSSWGGGFSSYIDEKKEEGKPTTTEAATKAELGFNEAWAEYKHGGFLNPKVVFGYRSLPLSAGTSLSSDFGGTPASPWLNSGGRKRGIRNPGTFIMAGSISEGPASFTVGATPDTFAGQAMLDFGLAKLKLLADADQSWWIGEIVQDPMHNELVVLDLGNSTFGVSLQAAARGLGSKFDFRAASALVTTSAFGFSAGATARYENESVQQIMAGIFFKTPSKWGETNIPRFHVAIAEPFTMQNGTFLEGSLIKDKAGFYAAIYYDNPILPNLQLSYNSKTEILFPANKADIVSDSISLSTSFGF